MPPEPSAVRGLPAMASISGVMARTSGTWRAPGVSFGSAVNNPSTSLSRTQASASIICATRPASRSLSPKRISSVATVSFSLITGTTRRRNSVAMVERALR